MKINFDVDIDSLSPDLRPKVVSEILVNQARSAHFSGDEETRNMALRLVEELQKDNDGALEKAKQFLTGRNGENGKRSHAYN